MTESRSSGRVSVALCNASILLYVAWLLLPAVQTTGRAMTGAFAVCLFACGVVCDGAYVKREWPWLLLRALCAVTVPLILWKCLCRGGSNTAGFYVQQVMFWFPLIFAAYARQRGDRRLWRFLRPVLLACVCVTVVTTIGWLIQGMLRGGRVYAYSRSLGFGGEGRDAYLKELMLRNIGGYDFVYAMVAALPLTCIGIQCSAGVKRAWLTALLAAQTVMIILSQYTYAMLFAGAILAVELTAALARRLSHGRLSMGRSLLVGAVPLLLVLLLSAPLAALGARVCGRLGLSNFAYSFEQMQRALRGGMEVAADSRLAHYLIAWRGFTASPLVGSLLGAPQQLSQHSEALDLLSGLGVLGTACFGGMVWLMGRGLLRGARSHPHRAQLLLMALAVCATALLGTIFYSRDIPAIAALGTLLVLEEK